MLAIPVEADQILTSFDPRYPVQYEPWLGMVESAFFSYYEATGTAGAEKALGVIIQLLFRSSLVDGTNPPDCIRIWCGSCFLLAGAGSDLYHCYCCCPLAHGKVFSSEANEVGAQFLNALGDGLQSLSLVSS